MIADEVEAVIWLNSCTIGYLLESLKKCEVLSQEQVDEIVKKSQEHATKIMEAQKIK